MRVCGLVVALLLPLIVGCKLLPQSADQPPVAAVDRESSSETENSDGSTAPATANVRPKPRPTSPDTSFTPLVDTAPLPAEGVVSEPVVRKSKEQVTCEKRGGRWNNAGKSGLKTCIKTTRDAGRQCRKEGDCESACLARSRTCAPVKPLFGCNEILQKNGSRATLCLD